MVIFPLKMVIFPFPIKNGDFPIKNCDFPIKNGDFPIKNGVFPHVWTNMDLWSRFRDPAAVPSRWRLEELDHEVLLTSALALASILLKQQKPCLIWDDMIYHIYNMWYIIFHM